MIFGQDRSQLRQMYIDAWEKSQAGEVLSPLEAQIAAVIQDHPEYQQMLTPALLDEHFAAERGETNPYLHMGLHLAIREQVATNRPNGIRGVFEKLSSKHLDRHVAEHLALECLAETLIRAQSDNAGPNEAAYLRCLKNLCISKA